MTIADCNQISCARAPSVVALRVGFKEWPLVQWPTRPLLYGPRRPLMKINKKIALQLPKQDFYSFKLCTVSLNKVYAVRPVDNNNDMPFPSQKFNSLNVRTGGPLGQWPCSLNPPPVALLANASPSCVQCAATSPDRVECKGRMNLAEGSRAGNWSSWRRLWVACVSLDVCHGSRNGASPPTESSAATAAFVL